MNNILILGAGRSATALISYVSEQAEKHHWFVMVADANPALAKSKLAGIRMAVPIGSMRPGNKSAWNSLYWPMLSCPCFHPAST